MAQLDFRTKAPAKPGASSAKETYTYEDMRAKHWDIKTRSVKTGAISVVWQYAAYPQQDARDAYGVDTRMFAAATDKQGMVDVIEENIENARLAHETPGQHFEPEYAGTGGGDWFWLVLLGLFLLDGNKRARR
jgi:hypothetical protein